MVAEGESLYETVPEIARACERLPTDTLLDGEIIALDQNGGISFNLLQHHRSQAQALLFYAFDILIYRGENMMAASLVKRRKALDNLFDNLGNKAAPISLSDTIDATPADLVRVVKEFGFEEIVAKRRDSTYESRQAERCLGQASNQQRTGVCHRRVRSRSSARLYYCRLLRRREVVLRCKGSKRFCAPHSARGGQQIYRLRNRCLPILQICRKRNAPNGL